MKKVFVLGSLVPISGDAAGIPVAAMIQSDISPGLLYPMGEAGAVVIFSPSGGDPSSITSRNTLSNSGYNY